jgi:hypothetical protein
VFGRDVLAEEHDGGVPADRVDLRRRHDLRVDDDAVDHAGLTPADGRALAVGCPTGLLEQQLVAVLHRDAGEHVRELGEVRPAEVGEREREHVRAPGRQAAAGDVRPVPELVDRGLHPVAHRRADVPVAPHHVGHGLHRHARVVGDVLQRDLAHRVTVPLTGDLQRCKLRA